MGVESRSLDRCSPIIIAGITVGTVAIIIGYPIIGAVIIFGTIVGVASVLCLAYALFLVITGMMVKSMPEQDEEVPPHAEDTLLICPICGRKQWVPTSTYLDIISPPGHPYTCGGENCPHHTEMVPADSTVAAYKNSLDKMKRRSEP